MICQFHHLRSMRKEKIEYIFERFFELIDKRYSELKLKKIDCNFNKEINGVFFRFKRDWNERNYAIICSYDETWSFDGAIINPGEGSLPSEMTVDNADLICIRNKYELDEEHILDSLIVIFISRFIKGDKYTPPIYWDYSRLRNEANFKRALESEK